MECGLTGLIGVVVMPTVTILEIELVTILLHCLVALTVRGSLVKKTLSCAMEMTAAQVQNIQKDYDKNNPFVDDTDYIGCFVKTGGLKSKYKLFTNNLTPCLCIGYCRSLNYSLAGTYYRQVDIKPGHKLLCNISSLAMDATVEMNQGHKLMILCAIELAVGISQLIVEDMLVHQLTTTQFMELECN